MRTAEPNLDIRASDMELIAASRAGNREAFGHIVSRYQSLICSLTFSATGSISQSEDLAQETFVAAWKQLPRLREPERLRSWLCQIARHHISDALRRQGREPSHDAHSLDSVDQTPSPDPEPATQTMEKEEEAILWRSLERIPNAYREPLVLFYREGLSVARVAAQFDLSEEAVKQRLSRGRKMLADEVTAILEGALKRSRPGRTFAAGVLAALPAFTVSAHAAALGTTALEGSATAKGAGVMGLGGALLAPLLVVFGTWAGYRMDLDAGPSECEQKYTKGFYRRLISCIAGFFFVYAGLMLFWRQLSDIHPALLPGAILASTLAYAMSLVALTVWSLWKRGKVVAELESQTDAQQFAKPAREYRSRFELCGLPFIHIRIGGNLLANRTPVKAWVAIGDCACGVLFAFGSVALAPVSVGGCAVGMLSLGGLAAGMLSMGGLSIGVWSFGGVALGWQAFGGCAVAWQAAVGSAAIAFDHALGDVAQASQSNNGPATKFIEQQRFFRSATVALRNLVWLNLLWIIPVLFWWRTIRRASSERT